MPAPRVVVSLRETISARGASGPRDLVQPRDQPASGDRSFLDRLRPRLTRLERQRNHIDGRLVEIDLQPAPRGLIGGVVYFGEDFIADRIEQAAANLEVREADVAGPSADRPQFDEFVVQQLLAL
jgi:hypothetical protein